MLTSALKACFQMLNTYSKKPTDIPNIRKGFTWLLGDYPISVVEAAFKQHLKQSRDFPTPADIVNIIDPQKEKISTVAYMSAKKRHKDSNGYYYKGMLNDDALIKEYEASEVEKIPAKKECLQIEDNKVGNLIGGLSNSMTGI